MFKSNQQFVDGIQTSLFLDESYNVTYGIFDHNLPEASEFDIVGFHAAEDVWNSSLKKSYIRRFRLNGVAKHFNISLLEFFKLTKVEADELLEQSIAANRATSRDAESIEDQLSRELNKVGG